MRKLENAIPSKWDDDISEILMEVEDDDDRKRREFRDELKKLGASFKVLKGIN